MLLLFITGGLFLGWSLGANDAANVFGTAVGTRMIKFRTAALICGVFVVIGAVRGGIGATQTLNSLGNVNSVSGAFAATLGAAASVMLMTRLNLPVSTSQAIVGSIIGWNLFYGLPTEGNVLTKILSTWVLCPALSGFFAVLLYILVRFILKQVKMHLLVRDFGVRTGLVIAGAFGSYSLGANNIANVMGVFVSSFPNIIYNLPLGFTVSTTQLLFFAGGLSIAIGVFTYSKRVMLTVGKSLFKLSPEVAFVVVLAQALVLFIFSSNGLESILISLRLPTIPLVPVSSTQAVVGAIIGIGLYKSSHGVKFNLLGKIAIGWMATPVIALIVTVVMLFLMR